MPEEPHNRVTAEDSIPAPCFIKTWPFFWVSQRDHQLINKSNLTPAYKPGRMCSVKQIRPSLWHRWKYKYISLLKFSKNAQYVDWVSDLKLFMVMVKSLADHTCTYTNKREKLGAGGRQSCVHQNRAGKVYVHVLVPGCSTDHSICSAPVYILPWVRSGIILVSSGLNKPWITHLKVGL